MEVINSTPYMFLPFDYSPAPTLPAVSLIVKGTFKLRPDEPARAVDKNKQQQAMGDDMFMDDIGRSLRYSSDLVPVKLRGEAMVSAVCYAEGGRARAAADASIAIGPIQKTLRVNGDRVWVRDPDGHPVIGRTQPFESVPLRWERAFGGMSYQENPLGRGIDPWPGENGKMVHYLPNVEYLARRVADPKDRPPPAGFGPLSPAWEPRQRRQGTRDQRWAMFRAPLPPQDFDPLFYNAAPEDQQMEGYFRGDEEIALTNLHKELPVYRSALPGSRLRLFLLIRKLKKDPKGEPAEPAPTRFIEVEMKLDTVQIDMETEELILVWRRPIKVSSRARPEIEAVYIAEESLAAEPAPLEAHFARFTELRGPKEPPLGEVLQEDIDKQMGEAKKVLRDGNVDPKLCDQIDGMKDPKQVFDALMRFAEGKVKELEALTASLKPPPGGE